MGMTRVLDEGRRLGRRLAFGDLEQAALRMREADLEKHLASGQGPEQKDPEREKARDEARKRLEEEAKKPPQDRKTPEFGSADDFPLRQALNNLKGVPVVASKTQVVVENKEEKKEN